jgi:hypothetical protein
MTQQRRPLTGMNGVPVAVTLGGQVTIHTLTTVDDEKGGDSNGGMIDEITLYVANDDPSNNALLSVTVDSGSAFTIVIPMGEVVKVFDGTPFRKAGGIITLKDSTAQNTGIMTAWGNYFTQG